MLVVEDNEINRLVTGEILSHAGYRYDMACDGREAITALHDKSYAIVLMDCQMPRMDGFEATQEIRRLEGQRQLRHCQERQRVTIVALTANTIPGNREKCLAAGMDGYLTKPIDRHQFIDVLQSYLQAKEGAVIQQVEATATPHPDAVESHFAAACSIESQSKVRESGGPIDVSALQAIFSGEWDRQESQHSSERTTKFSPQLC